MAQLNLLNTTWTLHRLSPLHHGKEFPSLLNNDQALKTYAARLRDHLTGGTTTTPSSSSSRTTFQLGGGASNPEDPDPSSSKTGALVSCTWETIPTLSLSGHTTTTTTTSTSPSDTTNRPRGRPRRPTPTPGTPGAGILITLTYDSQTYRAALLTHSAALSTSSALKPETHNPAAASTSPEPSSSTTSRKRTLRSQSHTQSTHLPLLLTKLPAPLRQSFLAFLAATFDTYTAGLNLASGVLCEALEAYVSSLLEGESGGLGREEEGEEGEVVEAVVRELHIMLGFQGPVAPGLRGLDICVPRGTIKRVVGRRRSGGGSGAEGGAEGEAEGVDVLGKVGEYLDTHLAMKVDLRAGKGLGSGNVVGVTRISCGGFLLGADGKMKLVGAGAAGQVGGEGEEEDADEDDDVPPAGAGRALSLKDRLALRAAEILLMNVVRRAAGEGRRET
ncbi:uncharacterized protein BP01DRAFT_379874 [Aspergillus saccharolyticus JOP 1030-1]|uniref:Uncharacterized protein n=1 Tax=Aspergillus saccharolyticus JOP 1030-1 TaxID=1450539 RepID=A0A318ZX75_9EURO|nr:hypothetical protein BP01DRAFT_379874 [Aspergillus saccharolyticus JOP 1030-1]PYH48690.1 hypothetical protein BP01DRAFT_379874 [Aspergillus saccharolyticus JOP 1030-1]